MKNGKNGSKALLIGIIGAVVVLAAVLGIVVMGCTPEQAAEPAATTTVAEASTYELYWNLDRAEYEGKSEAGMSGRMPESDGYFHIRMFKDGEIVTLKTSDRKVVNNLDTQSLMGLEFDEEGCISEVIDVKELPLETPGWSFFVQSVGGNTIKLNSSDSFAGMEMLLECDDDTGIYDMTGMSGEVGCEATPIAYDRVYPVANEQGKITHVFLYERSNFMLTHEAKCQHCDETVTWYEWTKTNTLPSKTGHYQLMADISEMSQVSFASDVKICLDLNGHEVHGKKDARLVSLHNPGTSLALMDTSEAQTGRMVGHSVASPQGGIVWVRYGQFHMYSGTLDGSDMASRLNGTVVQVPKNAFFYMYGGEIIGGTAAPQYNASTGKYTYGLGGAVQVAGTMRMYGGTIRDGKAPAAYYYTNGKLTLARGMGGNLFLSSGSVTEIAGGKILNGFAGNVGANIMMDGTAELTISGGEISGGKLEGRISKSGANLYVPGKSTVIMTGGKISDGRATNGNGGNFYLAGTLRVSNATISGGVAGLRGGNIYMAGTATLYIDRGTFITGGVANGTAGGNGGGNIGMYSDKAKVVMVGGTISYGVANGAVGEDGVYAGGDGGNINMNRGTVVLRGGYIVEGKAGGNGGGIYVGWNAKSLTLDQNIRIYDNETTDIVRSANTAKGKSEILLDKWTGNGTEGPAPAVGRLSGVAGTVVMTQVDGVELDAAEAEKFTSASPILPLEVSGTNVVLGKPYLGEADHTHCLCADKYAGHTCADTGFVSVDAETFRLCFAEGTSASSLMGSLNMCLTEDVTIDSEYAIAGNTFNLCLHGHTIHMTGNARITANGVSGVLNITDCTGKGKILAEDGCRASFLYTYKGELNIYGGTVDGSDLGVGLGSVRVGYAGDTFNLFGGTIVGSKIANNGGSIYCDTASTVNIYGGTVRDGVATAAGGGNIFLNHASAVLNIYGGTISGGKATATSTGSGLGGNIHIIKGKLNIDGGTITGGSAKGTATAGEPAGITGGVYVAYNAGTFTLTGNAKIYGNSGSDIWLTSKASYVVDLGDWNGNGDKGALRIGKTTAAAGTLLVASAEKADTEKFTSAVSGLVVKYEGGKLILATPFVHDHCICAGKVEGHSCTTTSFVEVENAEDFKALFASDNTLLESVSIALTGSFTLDAEYKTAGKTLNICLNGKTITMSGSGRITANGSSGVLNITDCGSGKIVAAAGARESFLYAYNGEVNLYAGTVDASAIVQTTASSGKSGGAVTVWASTDKFNMYGGTIIGAKMYRAGGVYVYDGLLTMYGGTIRDGYAAVGGNVATDRGAFTMLGGTITGGTAETNGAGVFCGYQSSHKMTLGGTAKIYGNTGAEDVYCGQKTAANNRIVLDNWQGNGANGALNVGSRSAANGAVIAEAKSGALTEAEVGKLASVHEGLALALNADGQIIFEEIVYHKHCVCNGTIGGNETHTCSVVTFTEVTADEFLALFGDSKKLTASHTVVLTEDVTLSAEYTLNGNTLNLCMNGKTITMSGNGRLTANGNSGVLNITDCGNGKIVAASGTTQSFLYTYNGTLNLYGGTVDGSAIVQTTASSGKSGGVINVYQPNDRFNMYGGKLIGATIYRGGSVYTYKGTFNMYGGTITGGHAGLGGAVATDYGSFNMLGGTITGNKAETNGAAVFLGYNSTTTLTLAGDAAIYGNIGAEEVYCGQKTAANNRIILDNWQGNGTGGAMTMGSRSAADGAVIAEAKTGTVTQAQLAFLAYRNTDYTLILNADGRVALKQLHKHCICNGKVTDNESHTCEKLTFTEVNAAQFLALFGEEKKLTASHTVVLTENVTLDAEYALNGNTLNLCLGGKTITMSGNGRLTANGTSGVLNITDCGSGKIVAAEGARAGILYTYKGKLNIYGGTVDASKCGAANSGAITVGYAGDELNIYGGTIIGSQNSKAGGSIYMNAAGTVTIYGGTVKNGKSSAGGGNIYIAAGETFIKGGTITGGTAGYGGNIQVYKTAVLNISGGTISGGSSTSTTSGHGGGNVYVGAGSETTGGVVMTGGTISDGSSVLEGGNINVNRGYMTLSGGTITGGGSETAGGGIYIGWNGTGVTLSGTALVYGNTGTDICRSANTSTSKGTFLLGDWAGNGTNGKAKLDSLFTATGKTVVAAASGYTITAADIAKFDCVGTYGLALSGGKLTTATK